jgi:hypothetical protein
MALIKKQIFLEKMVLTTTKERKEKRNQVNHSGMYMGHTDMGMGWKTRFISHKHGSEQKIFFHQFDLTVLNLFSSCYD